jgi:hypothetical protein
MKYFGKAVENLVEYIINKTSTFSRTPILDYNIEFKKSKLWPKQKTCQ